MNKISKNKEGFTAVEGLLIILILVVIVGVGYMVYHNNHKTNTNSTASKTAASSSSTSTKTTTSTNPYAGWKTSNLQYEKITYQYPSDWTISDNSQTASQSEAQGGCAVNPGVDNVTLTAPSGATVNLSTGIQCKAGLAYGPYVGFLPIRVLGSNDYIAAAPNTTNIVDALIASNNSSSNLSLPQSKNITGSNDPLDVFDFTPAATSGESLTALKSDPNFVTAKLIFESMTY